MCSNDTEKHFLCFEDFCYQVKVECNDLALFTKQGSAIACCECRVQKPSVISRYNDIEVCSICIKTDDSAMKAFLEVQKRVATAFAKAEFEGRIARVREEGEIKRLEEFRHFRSEAEKRKITVTIHRRQIIDKILSNHCPHCDMVIHDWVNCDAVFHGPSESV